MAGRKVDSLTVAQTALTLGVSTRRVRQMIDEGQLSTSGGRPLRIPQKQVMSLKAKRKSLPQVVKVKAKPAPAKVKSPSEDLNNDDLINIFGLMNDNGSRTIEALELAEARNREFYLAQISSALARIDHLQDRIENLLSMKRW